MPYKHAGNLTKGVVTNIISTLLPPETFTLKAPVSSDKICLSDLSVKAEGSTPNLCTKNLSNMTWDFKLGVCVPSGNT